MSETSLATVDAQGRIVALAPLGPAGSVGVGAPARQNPNLVSAVYAPDGTLKSRYEHPTDLVLGNLTCLGPRRGQTFSQAMSWGEVAALSEAEAVARLGWALEATGLVAAVPADAGVSTLRGRPGAVDTLPGWVRALADPRRRQSARAALVREVFYNDNAKLAHGDLRPDQRTALAALASSLGIAPAEVTLAQAGTAYLPHAAFTLATRQSRHGATEANYGLSLAAAGIVGRTPEESAALARLAAEVVGAPWSSQRLPWNTCVGASEFCRATCLVVAGSNTMGANAAEVIAPFRAKWWKTLLLRLDPAAAFRLMVGAMMEAAGYRLDPREPLRRTPPSDAESESALVAWRSNVYSDIPWEWLVPEFYAWADYHMPRLRFYDYTKIGLRHPRPSPNYHLVLSWAGDNDDDLVRWIARGGNVALVFFHHLAKFKGRNDVQMARVPLKRYKDKGAFSLPKSIVIAGAELPVLDATQNDARFLDPQGICAGLVWLPPISNAATEAAGRFRIAATREEFFAPEPEKKINRFAVPVQRVQTGDGGEAFIASVVPDQTPMVDGADAVQQQLVPLRARRNPRPNNRRTT